MWEPYNIEKRIEINCFYSVYFEKFEKGFVFEGEKHDFWEMVYVSEGKMYVTADGKESVLNKGDVIFHKPMEFHEFTLSHEEESELFIISFSASGLLMENFKCKSFTLHGGELEKINDITSYLNNFEFSDYTNLFIKSPFTKQILSCMMELFFISLVENGYISSVPQSSDAVLFHKAVNEMKARINEWVNVPEVATACSVSVSKLKNIFSKYAGIGVHKYFLKMKMVRAFELLAENYTVAETAEMLGFENQNYFSAVFKRENGTSPSEYKKTLKML